MSQSGTVGCREWVCVDTVLCGFGVDCLPRTVGYLFRIGFGLFWAKHSRFCSPPRTSLLFVTKEGACYIYTIGNFIALIYFFFREERIV